MTTLETPVRRTGKVMIRKATTDDQADLARLAKHFITEHPGYNQVLRWDEQHVAGLVERCLQIGIIFVAESGRLVAGPGPSVRPDGELRLTGTHGIRREIVGFIAAFPLADPFSGALVVDEIGWWVDVSHRHGSIGPRLLRSLLHWAQQKRFRFVKMIAPEGSNVGKYYERLGFQPIETIWILKLPAEG